MTLRVRHQGGPEAGRLLEFDEKVEKVALGRDPSCQVVFPRDERPVGRFHCTIERAHGHYVLRVDKDHLVLVDDAPAVDGQELGDRCDVQLGPGGPKLVVERIDTSPLPGTIAQHGAPGATSQLRAVTGRTRRTRTLSIATAVVLVAGGIGLYAVVRRLGREVRVTEAKVERLPDEIRQRTGLGLTDRLREAQRSVYQVVVRDQSGGASALGTAWVVRPNQLATNAHVAGEFDDTRKNGLAMAV